MLRSDVTATVVVPTFNEGRNCRDLVQRMAEALPEGAGVEVLFVDDSTDSVTPDIIRTLTLSGPLPVRMIHREGDERIGGLAGAVTAGIRAAHGRDVVVMDGDLQHPPELVLKLEIEEQSRIEIHFSIEADGPLPTKDQIVRF